MCRAILAVTLLAVLGSGAAAESVTITEYRGRCQRNDEFDPFEVDFSLAAADTSRALSRRLPALEETAATVVVTIVDAVPDPLERVVPVPGLSLRPFRLELDDTDRPRVVFFAEPFFFETTDTFSEAARGVTEAILRLRLAGRGVPDWLFDGLALWALEGEDATDLPDYGWDLPDLALARGLEEPWAPTDRFRDRMVIRYLVRQAGEDGADRLAAALAAGKPPEAAVKAVAELSYAEFERHALEFTRDRVQARRTEETAPLLDGYAALRTGDYEEAARQAERMIGSPAEQLHPHALLLGAIALAALDSPDVALKPLTHFFHLIPHETDFKNVLIGEEPPEVGLLMGPIHLELGRCRRATGDLAGAAAAYAKILTSYPEGELLPDALLEQAQCEGERGRDEVAASLAALWLRSFPEHPRRPEAEALAGPGDGAEEESPGP